MNKKNVEVSAMKYFAEKVNLDEFLDIAKKCATQWMNIEFNNIITDDFQMPTAEEMKKMTIEHVPYEFDADDFKANGPLNFSSDEYENIEQVMEAMESIYKKFHDAQALVVAKAGITALEKMIDNISEDINSLKDKYLGDK